MAAPDETLQAVKGSREEMREIDPWFAAEIYRRMQELGEPYPKWLVEWVEGVMGLPFERAQAEIERVLEEATEDLGISGEGRISEGALDLVQNSYVPEKWRLQAWLDKLDRQKERRLQSVEGKLSAGPLVREGNKIRELILRVSEAVSGRSVVVPPRIEETARDTAIPYRKGEEANDVGVKQGKPAGVPGVGSTEERRIAEKAVPLFGPRDGGTTGLGSGRGGVVTATGAVPGLSKLVGNVREVAPELPEEKLAAVVNEANPVEGLRKLVKEEGLTRVQAERVMRVAGGMGRETGILAQIIPEGQMENLEKGAIPVMPAVGRIAPVTLPTVTATQISDDRKEVSDEAKIRAGVREEIQKEEEAEGKAPTRLTKQIGDVPAGAASPLTRLGEELTGKRGEEKTVEEGGVVAEQEVGEVERLETILSREEVERLGEEIREVAPELPEKAVVRAEQRMLGLNEPKEVLADLTKDLLEDRAQLVLGRLEEVVKAREARAKTKVVGMGGVAELTEEGGLEQAKVQGTESEKGAAIIAVPLVGAVPIPTTARGSKTAEEGVRKAKVAEMKEAEEKLRLGVDYSQKGFFRFAGHVLGQAASPVTGVAGALWASEAEGGKKSSLPEMVRGNMSAVNVVLGNYLEKVPRERREITETTLKLRLMYGIGRKQLEDVSTEVAGSSLPGQRKGELLGVLALMGKEAGEFEATHKDLVKGVASFFGNMEVGLIKNDEISNKAEVVFLRNQARGTWTIERSNIRQAPAIVMVVLGQSKGLLVAGLGKVVGSAVKGGAKRAALWLGAKLGIQAAATAVAPGVGNAIAWVGTVIIGKVWGLVKNVLGKLASAIGIWSKKEGASKWWVPAALVGGGLLILPILPMIGTALLVIGGLAAAISFIGSVAAVGGAALSLAGTVVSAVGGVLATLASSAAIIAGVGIVSVAGVVYLETSHVWEVFQTVFSGPMARTVGEGGPAIVRLNESEHMRIEKRASVSCLGGPGCPDISTPIIYSVTVTAKGAGLIGPKIDSNVFRIVGEGQDREITPPVVSLPSRIARGESKTISYPIGSIGNRLNNSVVSDTVKISAGVEVGGVTVTETATDTAVITIGTPPVTARAEELVAILVNCYGDTVTDANFGEGECLASHGVKPEIINVIAESLANFGGELQCVGFVRAVMLYTTGVFLPQAPGGDAWSYNCGSDGCVPVTGFTFNMDLARVQVGDALIFGSGYGAGSAGSIAYVTSVSGLPENPYICTVHANIGGVGDVHANDCYYANGTPYLSGYIRSD